METVLAIDDDKTTLGILESQLSSFGYRVFVERAAKRGLEIAKEFVPDVILLDINMPVMSGFDVLANLKRDKATRDIPVIMLTSNKERTSVIEAMRYGISDYIVKPYDPDKLNLKIKSAIAHADIKRNQSSDVFIEIARKGEMALVIMRGSIKDNGFKNDVKTVFNSFFMKQVNGKVCVFDIRNMEDFDSNDVKEFVSLLKFFSDSKIKVITGKHYGSIVSNSDIENTVELYLSYGDMELASI